MVSFNRKYKEKMDILFRFDEPRRPPMPTSTEMWRLGKDKRGVKDSVKNASDVAFVEDTYFVVADSEGHGLPMYESTGYPLSVVAAGQVWPNCVAATREGKIVVTDRQSRRTKLYDITGVCIREIGEELWDGEFEIELRPHGVAVNSKGQILITDTTLQKIRVYSEAGELLQEFGGEGHRVSQLTCPFYLAVDSMDNMIVSDNMNYAIKKFDPYGNYLMKIGSGQDWGHRSFQCPYGVSVDRYGNILVADHESNRIAMYNENGELLGDIVSKKLCRNPCGVAINRKGELVFTENNTDYTNIKAFKVEYDDLLIY